MPEPVAQLEEPLAVVGRHDLAVLVEVGEIADPGAQPIVRRLADGAGPGLGFERAEVLREGDLLLVGDVLAMEDEHGEAVHAVIDRRGVLAADRLGQVDARHLAGEPGMDLPDGRGHGGLLLRMCCCSAHSNDQSR